MGKVRGAFQADNRILKPLERDTGAIPIKMSRWTCWHLTASVDSATSKTD